MVERLRGRKAGRHEDEINYAVKAESEKKKNEWLIEKKM